MFFHSKVTKSVASKLKEIAEPICYGSCSHFCPLLFDNYNPFADVRFELKLESFDSSGKLF